MSTKRELAQKLGVIVGFDNPEASLEQYRTPPGVAAHLVHLADLNGDLAGRTVLDLGCGTGMLALGATLRASSRVIGIDIDDAPLSTARANAKRVGTQTEVAWIRGDVTRLPVCPDESVTVLMNPPFGAQSDNVHADRAFLEITADVSSVSYSIHNAGSEAFVEAFADDNDGQITAAYGTTMTLPQQFSHHEADEREIEVELFRIEWESSSSSG